MRFVLRVVGIEREIGEREKERERERAGKRERGREREEREREEKRRFVSKGLVSRRLAASSPPPCGNPLATEVGFTSCCPDQITHCCVRC